MNRSRLALARSLLISLVLATPAVIADEKHEHDHEHEQRQHGVHAHGVAALNLALEGEEVYVEFDSPAANIIGFEHAPSSEAEHAALDKAVATLKAGDRLFRFNTEAGCRLEAARVRSALLDEEHAEHADEHGRETKDAHGHAEHQHDEHGHEEHGHAEHAGETHSDIDAAYHFACDRPGKLTQLTVELFAAFSGMHELNVQYVIESKQGATKLSPAKHVVTF